MIARQLSSKTSVVDVEPSHTGGRSIVEDAEPVKPSDHNTVICSDAAASHDGYETVLVKLSCEDSCPGGAYEDGVGDVIDDESSYRISGTTVHETVQSAVADARHSVVRLIVAECA